MVEEKALFRAAQVIPLPEIQAIGLDAVIVRSKDSVIDANRTPKIHQILHHNIVLRGTRFLTTDGINLGTLVDLFFDEASGLVEGYEVSGGLFADAYSGRSFVPAPETLKIGYDVAFVSPEIAQMMQEQVGGVRGAVQAAGSRIQESAGAANQGLQSAAQTASNQLQTSVEAANRRLQAAGEAANAKLQAATDGTSNRFQDLNRDATASLTNRLVDPSEQKTYVVGKRVDRDVLTPDGSVLLLEGQEVTLVEAEAADRMGILDELYRATGGSLTATINRDWQAATDSASTRLQRATETTAAHLRRSVDAARSAIEQARGRRVMQTVRTEDGLIVAASGQIVTEPVLDRAQAYGRESALLNAVGLTPTPASRASTSDSWSDTKIQLHERASVAQRNLSSFWQTVQAKAEELQGRSARAIQQQRIEQALGRPVTRVILDPEDNVILNVGELITHRAIRFAEESGVLNILLSSVYVKEPEISDKELRASEHGAAALEHHANGRSQPEARPVSMN